MSDPVVDVVGVGNAIVDVISSVGDDFIVEHHLQKGAMTLIDTDRAIELYDVMPPGIEASGGSAANTMAGIASFGGRASYIGKVRDDELGAAFATDIAETGVGYDMVKAPQGPPTARCLIQVTPDAQRTMNTYLGISALLEPADIDADLVRSAKVVYCEGYLWDVEEAKQAIRFAMDTAHDAGRVVAMTLSDGFCVDRHREEWLELLAEKVDIVFGNTSEVCSLFETDDFGAALEQLRAMVDLCAITVGPQGSVTVTGDQFIESPAVDVETVVDTTGAGDLFAAGFLYGYTNGADLAECGRLANIAAGEIISHMGARPETPLSSLA